MAALEESTKGLVLNIQRYSLDDGPGLRSTVFLKGCPLRCLWCSNPESQGFRPELVHRIALCEGCGRCVERCGQGALSIGRGGLRVNRRKCTACGACTESCRREALKIAGAPMSVEETFGEVRRDVAYYAKSEWTYMGRRHPGGVTLSGGEPLSQIEFATALLRRCREEGIHTCVDTSGYAPTRDLARVIPYACLVLFDLKHAAAQVHRSATGLSNREILRNLKLLVSSEVPTVVRIPLVPRQNDSESDVAALAGLVAALDRRLHVHLMPYHQFGVGKYRMLGRRYPLEGTEPFEEARLERARETVQSKGLTCEIIAS